MTSDPILQIFVEAFCKSCTEVFSRTTAMEWSVIPGDAEIGNAPLAFRFEVEGGAQGAVSVSLSRSETTDMVRSIMGDSSNAVDEMGEDGIDFMKEMLTEAFGGAFASASLGLPSTSVKWIQAPPEQPKEEAMVLLTATCDGKPPIKMQLRSTTGVLASLKRALETPEKAANHTGLTGNANLGLVLDVELKVNLRFGKREMTLRDIADLTSGAIVELEQEAHESVELLLDDRVIARGEVVIVDGNYGLRITELVS